jgi:hypothetical protein
MLVPPPALLLFFLFILLLRPRFTALRDSLLDHDAVACVPFFLFASFLLAAKPLLSFILPTGLAWLLTLISERRLRFYNILVIWSITLPCTTSIRPSPRVSVVHDLVCTLVKPAEKTVSTRQDDRAPSFDNVSDDQHS